LLETQGAKSRRFCGLDLLKELDDISFIRRTLQCSLKATHASTNGAVSFIERTLPPGGRKPPHIHTHCEEAFYVLDGEVEFVLGDDTVIGRPGSFVLVPGGVPHTFGNAAAAPSRLLVIHAPAIDAYFEELQTLWSVQLPPTPRER